MNYYFYEIKMNLILLHIYVNFKKKYNNQILLKDKFNILVYLIKKYIHKHIYFYIINMFMNIFFN